MEGYCELQHANMVDFVTDETGNSLEIDKQIHNLARQVIRDAESDYVKPSTFLGIGGNKIFRDAIYGKMRFPFQEIKNTIKKMTCTISHRKTRN